MCTCDVRCSLCLTSACLIAGPPCLCLVHCCALPQLWNLPWWHCSSGSCVDEGTNEIEYMEKVITTLQSKYQVDTNKVRLAGWTRTAYRQNKAGQAAGQLAAVACAAMPGLASDGHTSSSSSISSSSSCFRAPGTRDTLGLPMTCSLTLLARALLHVLPTRLSAHPP